MFFLSGRRGVILVVIAFVVVIALVVVGLSSKSPQTDTSNLKAGQMTPIAQKVAEQKKLTDNEIKALVPLARTAYKAGLSSCVADLTTIHNSFLSKTPSRSVKMGMEQGALVVSAEIDTKAQTIYMSLSAMQDEKQHCQITYDMVTHWPATCTAVYEGRFSTFAIKGHILKNIALLEAAGKEATRQKLYMMSLGKNGCVTISKRVLY